MPSLDATHFDEYRIQTLVKHKILEGYLPAYFRALNSNPKIGYIDAFAGRGYYTKENGEEALGSPLLALALIGNDAGLASRVLTMFSETRDDYFKELNARVESFKTVHPLAFKPRVVQEDFAGVMTRIRGFVKSLIPTFLFVDPCGVKGVDFASMKWVLSQPGSELFLFFNSSAIRRLVGDVEQDQNRRILEAYFGSTAIVESLLTRWSATGDPRARELAMVDALRSALIAIPDVLWVLPFRVEHADREDTSHYFIHATKHPLGFRLMKYVMREYLANHGLTDGELELRQASYAAEVDLFAGYQVEEDVLSQLESGPKRVRHFTHGRTEVPTIFWSEMDYKRAVLRLEEKRAVKVCKDQAGTDPKPAEKRFRKNPKSKEREVTLGVDLWVIREPS